MTSVFSHKHSHSHGQGHLRRWLSKMYKTFEIEKCCCPTWNCNPGPQPSALHNSNIKALPDYFCPLVLMHHLWLLKQETRLEKVPKKIVLSNHNPKPAMLTPQGRAVNCGRKLARSANPPFPPLLQCACVPVFLARCVSLLYDVVRVRANPLSQEHVCVTPTTLIFHWHLETVHDASQSPDPERHGKNMCYQYSLNIKIVTLLCKGKAHNFCFTNNGMERMLYVMDNESVLFMILV